MYLYWIRGDDFGYRLWNLKNHKIFRSRDVVFNEKVMYKDQLQGKKEEKENTKYTVLAEIKENEVPMAPENQEQQQVLETPAVTEKYAYGLGCTIIDRVTIEINRFPICKRNKTSNTKGY